MRARGPLRNWLFARLPEGQVRLDPGDIGLVDPGGFRHVAFALGALRGQQVTPGGMLAPDFSGPGDLEPFRDGFPGFAARNRLWHKARKITQPACVTTAFARRRLPHGKCACS